MISYTLHLWNRFNYHQKCILYRLVNNNIVHPKERYLDIWWSSLPMYRREEIISDLMEFMKHD